MQRRQGRLLQVRRCSRLLGLPGDVLAGRRCSPDVPQYRYSVSVGGSGARASASAAPLLLLLPGVGERAVQGQRPPAKGHRQHRAKELCSKDACIPRHPCQPLTGAAEPGQLGLGFREGQGGKCMFLLRVTREEASSEVLY